MQMLKKRMRKFYIERFPQMFIDWKKAICKKEKNSTFVIYTLTHLCFSVTKESWGSYILGVEVHYVGEIKNFEFLHDIAKKHGLGL